jgi:hypothetical protein
MVQHVLQKARHRMGIYQVITVAQSAIAYGYVGAAAP